MAFSVFLFSLLLLQASTIASSQNLTNLFPAILVFGDSTADSGNNNHLRTPLKANHPPYGQDFPGKVPTGRFSNGKLVPDILATLLGIKEAVPPFLQPDISDYDIRTGVNFASAGSGYDDLTADISLVIPVSKQTLYFKLYIKRLKKVVGAKQAERILNGALVSISAGTNDFAYSFYDYRTRRPIFKNIGDYQDFVLTKLHNFVNELYSLGCRKMVITGLPPIGCLPIQITSNFKDVFARKCIEKQNADARSYNQKLVKLLPQIQSSLQGSSMFYADIYQPLMDMIRDPGKFGFSETRVGCCGTGFLEAGLTCTRISPICTNASSYMFFDSIHPTEAVYHYLAKNMADLIRHKS